MRRINIRLCDLGLILAGSVLLWISSPGALRPLGGLTAFIALIPFVLITRADRVDPSRRVYLPAFLLGFFYYLLADSWLILNFSGIYFFKAAGSAGVMLAAAFLIRRLSRRLPLALATALAWSAMEWGRVNLPELPCAHHQLAHSLFNHSWFVGSASLIGEVGLNFLVAFIGGALTALWCSWRESRPAWAVGRRQVGVAAAILIMNALGAWFALGGVETRVGPDVGLVQGNPPTYSLTHTGIRETFGTNLVLTRELAAEGSLDLVVWGETTFPGPLMRGIGARASWQTMSGQVVERKQCLQFQSQEAEAVSEILSACSLKEGGGLVVGATKFRPSTRQQGLLVQENVAGLWDREGKYQGSVSKRNLVPGGEFLPIFRQLPWGLGLACEKYFRSLGIPAMRPGVGPRTLALPGTGRFGLAICYDNAFIDYFCRATLEGADWHLVISNENWYGEGAELDQLLAQTVIYAIACGRSVLRCTNSGISCLVSPTGKIGPLLQINGRDRLIRGRLKVNIPIATGHTLAATVSGWSGFLVLILSFLFAFFHSRWPGG